MLKALLLVSTLVASSPAGAAEAASGGAAVAAQDATTRPLTPEERAQAMQELQDLRARMSRIEAMLGVPSALPPPVPVPPAPSRPKDHNLELYGFLQLDAIQDFNRVNPDW